MRIADVEPFSFSATLDEEPIYRKAAHAVNKLWDKFLVGQPDKSSHYALAKAALAFAELYYRKDEMLDRQTKMLEEFEHELDELLLKIDD